jgi:putative transcriptional regulator
LHDGSVSHTGRLLVAAPGLRDPNFQQTIVLLLDHNSDGSFGVVLNRPLEVEVAAVLPGWESVASRPARVFGGGPVGLDSALGLVAPAGLGDPIAGSFALVDLDVEPHEPGVSDLRIFAGHSGWAAGQLEVELEAGDWFVVDARPGDPFTDRPERLWQEVLRRQGGDLALLSTWPADPSLN